MPRRYHFWIDGVFLLSGSAALVYQVAWQRLLVQFAGGDVTSTTITIAAFMAGLGVGSLVGGRLADKLSCFGNMGAFALAELAIAVLGASSVGFFQHWLPAWISVGELSATALGLLLFTTLLPATFLMGLSLPVLAKAVTNHFQEAAGRIGALYALNTLGAALGALCATWVLLPQGGIGGAISSAAALNALCALAMLPAVWLARPRDHAPTSIPPATTDSPTPADPLTIMAEAGASTARFHWCVALFFVTGFTALAAEMVWLRALGALAKASAQTFGTILAFYLGGLGLGALAGSAWVRRSANPWRSFLCIQGVAVLLAAVGLPGLLAASQQCSWFEPLRIYLDSYEPVDADTAIRLLKIWMDNTEALAPDDRAFLWIYPIAHGLLPLLVVFPATFLMGFGFPLMQKAAQTDASRVGWRTGALQAANILGSVAGAAGVSVWFLPLWGSTGVLLLLAAAGMFLLVAAQRGTAPRAVLVLAGLAILHVMPNQISFWAQVHGTSKDRLVLAEDGSGVSVLKRPPVGEQAGQTSVFVNGIGQSWIPYGGVHSLLGVLPVLLHPFPERVALIGLGSGDTLYAMLGRKETREAWCAEIVGAQFKTLRKVAKEPGFEPVAALLADPRARLEHADGRMMLLRERAGFDIIEADALRPTSAHSGTLYSEEHFQLLASRLKPGGMAVTWVPTPRVAASLARVFPHVTIFGGMIAIGTQEPLTVDTASLQARVSDPELLAHFQRAGVDLHALLAPIFGPQAQNQSIGPEFDRTTLGEPNTDLFPRDEMALPNLWQVRSN